jgi:hypothetical protein
MTTVERWNGMPQVFPPVRLFSIDAGVLLLEIGGIAVDDLRDRPADRDRIVELDVDGARGAGDERGGPRRQDSQQLHAIASLTID